MNRMTTMASFAAVREKPDTADAPGKKPSSRSLWAWGVVLVLVNLPLMWGEIRTEFIFFPEAAIEGQWWRVLTYPLVHLSWYHFLLDAGGFLLVFRCLEEDRALTRMLYIAGAGFGSLGLSLALDSSGLNQGLSGLSGIAHGLMAVTALEMLAHPRQKTWGVVSLALVTAKSAYELWTGHVFFEFMHMGMCGQPLAASHAGGVVGGILAYIVYKVLSQKEIIGNTGRRVGI